MSIGVGLRKNTAKQSSGKTTIDTNKTTSSSTTTGSPNKVSTTKKKNVEQSSKNDGFTQITSNLNQVVDHRDLNIDQNVKTERAPRKKTEEYKGVSSKKGKTGTDLVPLKPEGGLQSKPLHETFQKFEKDVPEKMRVEQKESGPKKQSLIENRTIRGEQVETHKKLWQVVTPNNQELLQNKLTNKVPVTENFGTKVEKQVESTQYLNEGQRQKLEIKGQQHHDMVRQSIKGETILMPKENTVLSQKDGKVLDTTEMKDKRAIFVMDEKGKLYGASESQQRHSEQKIWNEPPKVSDFHHSSFLSGKPVTGAGELSTDKEGHLKKLTDRSGHYRPGSTQTLQTINELKDKGVNMDNVQFEIHRGDHKKPEVTKGMVGEYVQGGGSETLFKARHDVSKQAAVGGDKMREQRGEREELRRVIGNEIKEKVKVVN